MTVIFNTDTSVTATGFQAFYQQGSFSIVNFTDQCKNTVFKDDKFIQLIPSKHLPVHSLIHKYIFKLS